MNLSSWVQTMGVESSAITDEPDTSSELIKEKSTFIHYLIKAGNEKSGEEIPLKAVQIKQRFMNTII
jgi:sulfopyruvate decarboxylase subunit beta